LVGTQHNGIRWISKRQEWSICISQIEWLNSTQRLFLKRLSRLTMCFSKRLRNIDAAFAMFATYYDFCWQTPKLGKNGKHPPAIAMMAKQNCHIGGAVNSLTLLRKKQYILR
jgi:hypothetical protein